MSRHSQKYEYKKLRFAHKCWKAGKDRKGPPRFYEEGLGEGKYIGLSEAEMDMSINGLAREGWVLSEVVETGKKSLWRS